MTCAVCPSAPILTEIPIKFEERAKTGDATRGEILTEYTLIGDNPDASAKIQSVT